MAANGLLKFGCGRGLYLSDGSGSQWDIGLGWGRGHSEGDVVALDTCEGMEGLRWWTSHSEGVVVALDTCEEMEGL